MRTSTGSSGPSISRRIFSWPASASKRAEFVGELEGDIGILGGVFGEGFERDGGDVEVLGGFGFLGEGEEIVGRCGFGGLRAGDVGEFDRRVAEQDFG